MRRIALGALLALPLAATAADGALPKLLNAESEYTQRRAAPDRAACAEGEAVALPVSLGADAPLEVAADSTGGHLHIRYRMAFNDITEGWNWHPERAAEGEDYYTFKYLPVGSSLADRGTYQGEDKIGSPQTFSVQLRTDDFFGFDNVADFYRRAGDDFGFGAEVDMAPERAARLAGGDLRMAVGGRLAKDCLASSNTFWKATSARPVDFTLTKHYLIGTITDVWFFDAASGDVVAHLVAQASAPSR